MSPFFRFTLLFVVTVVLCFAAFLYFSGRLPFGPARTVPSGNAPSSAMQPLGGSTPASTPAASNPTTSGSPEPAPLENPPDINGMNLPAASVPGSDLSAAAPVQNSNTAKATANTENYVADLSSRSLRMPIEGVQPSQLYDSYNDARGGSKHEANDIMAARGTPVLAIDEGNIVKLFTSKKGGLTIYQFDNSRSYCYYYAHLDHYAANIKEGMLVRAGEVIGYVGSSGDADAASPHLHFAINVLSPEKKWWQGTPVNPYPVLLKIAQKAK